jgi:hypothetical protein
MYGFITQENINDKNCMKFLPSHLYRVEDKYLNIITRTTDFIVWVKESIVARSYKLSLIATVFF